MKTCKFLEEWDAHPKKLGASKSGQEESLRWRNPPKSGKNETSTVDVHENKGFHDIFTENKSGFLSDNAEIDENGPGFMSENARTTLKLNRKFTIVAPSSVLRSSRPRSNMAATPMDRGRSAMALPNDTTTQPGVSKAATFLSVFIRTGADVA